MAPALKSCFEITINLKQKNLNFGVAIYLKNRHLRQARNRYTISQKIFHKNHLNTNNWYI